MKPDWTLIANSTRARLLQQKPGSPMVILESFIHPANPTQPAELSPRAVHPRTGRLGEVLYAATLGTRRSEQTEFARELGHLLEQEAQLDHFRTLTVFASRPFLGELRAQLGKATQRRLLAVHEADLTTFTLSELEERIANELAPVR